MAPRPRAQGETGCSVLKRAREAAEQSKMEADAANRAKSAFLANMSHEFRTPMNAILGFSQLIFRDPELSAENRENLGIVRRSGEHLRKLINNVLAMSKIESGKMQLHEIARLAPNFQYKEIVERISLLYFR